MIATELNLNGKTLPVFAAKQLESMSPQVSGCAALISRKPSQPSVTMCRCRAIRRLLRSGSWTPKALLQGGHGAVMEQARPTHGQGADLQQQRAQQPDIMSEAGRECSDAYPDARMGASAARTRNMGSSNILSWS